MLVKIADFGLAQVTGSENITAKESIVGTPAYMSPEQVQGTKIDEQSDLFSLGIVIYELFYGVNPFLGNDAGKTLNNILKCNQPDFPAEKNVPDFIVKIIKNLLVKKKSERTSTANALLKFFPDQKSLPTLSKQKIRKRKIRHYLIPVLIIGIYLIVQNIFFPATYIEEEQKTIPVINESDSLKNRIIQSPLENKGKKPDLVTQKVVKENIKKSETAIQKPSEQPVAITGFGFLDVHCSPWADIILDSVKTETTPLKDPLKLKTGKYILELSHPDFPKFKSTIHIQADDTVVINVNLDTLAAYFYCNVYPWGNIYINNEFKGQTPLNSPIILNPGVQNLEIRNPKYKTYFREINLVKADTLKFTVNLDSLNNP